MNSLTAIKSGLALAFLTSITILVALMGAQAGNHETAAPAPTAAAAQNAPAPRNTASRAQGALVISSPVARMSFGRAVNSAGFLTITNSGKQDDVLIGASSGIAKRTELHTHIRDGQIMRMRRVEGGIKVPMGGAARLQPGGFHIMFIGLAKPLKNGDVFPLTLIFKKAGNITTNMTARKKIPHGAPMTDDMKMDHSHRGSH
ncbi:MAG: copper chaperone PCu(A)C [Hyphomicrobiaceae bacterium]|nr:copper chaperone PCu(A)C [Hyphomicrobiaceae bacterium]